MTPHLCQQNRNQRPEGMAKPSGSISARMNHLTILFGVKDSLLFSHDCATRPIDVCVHSLARVHGVKGDLSNMRFLFILFRSMKHTRAIIQ
jgi:hypothetical protein